MAENTDADGDGEFDDAAVQVFAAELASCEITTDCNGPLTFSVNRVGETPSADQTSIVLTCDDRYQVDLEVYVWDNANNPIAIQPDGSMGGANYKFCTVEVFVQDPQVACNDCLDDIVTLRGNITTPSGQAVEGIELYLSGGNEMMAQTDVSGGYEFGDGETGQNYTLTPHYDRDHMNGISTRDLVALARNIMGVGEIFTPYQMIAGDVDNSENISTIDLLILRQMILGDKEFFPNNTSWRFIDGNYEFPDNNDPWMEEMPEIINLIDLETCQNKLDFTAVKVGDIDHSAIPSADIDTRTGNRSTLIKALDQSLNQGDTYELEFTSDELNNLEGMQFTLSFDDRYLEFVDLEGAVAKENEFSLNFIDRAMITGAWVNTAAIRNELLNDRVVFKLTLRAKENLNSLEGLIDINSRLTNAEAYDLNGQTLNVQLGWVEAKVEAGVTILNQNWPNPWTQKTTITFELPEAQSATIFLQDYTGKVLKVYEGDYAKGVNQIEVQRGDLAAGLLYYTLQTANGHWTKKMIITE
ncbi:MAG: T9SS type A sorting domain-containing protein [Bacteroidota bacterium]